MSELVLLGRQRQYLKGLAHSLAPVVLMGNSGASPAVALAVDRALLDHELIKVRMPQVAKSERKEMAQTLCDANTACNVGMTGRVLIVYRPHPQKPEIRLPK